MTKTLTVLFVARHYPPHITGAARRLSGMTRELRALGHRVIVAAPDLPDGEDGVRVPHVQPVPGTSDSTHSGGLQSAKALARRWLLWPDADIRWSRRAAAALEPFAAEADWVLTSSPPESAHAAGLMLTRKHKLLWAADFRDLWFERPLRPELANPMRRGIERPWAKRVLKRADLVLAVDRYIAHEGNRLAGIEKAVVLPHASDTPDVEPWRFEPGLFHLVHTGSFSLSDSARRIEQLITTFETVSADTPNLRLHIAGRLTSQEKELIQRSTARDVISDHGIVDQTTALAMQKGASALVLVGSPQSHVPPGKYVEYVALGKPIIVFGQAIWREQINPKGNAEATLRALLNNKDEFFTPINNKRLSHADIADQLSKMMLTKLSACPKS